MRTFITTIILIFTIAGFAQDPMMQDNSEALEDVAVSVTERYNDKLALDAKQYILFQKKVEEFLIREEKIHKSLNGEEKLNALYKLRKAESLEIRNILTKHQFDLYKRLKPQIQPLAIVETKEK